MKTIATYFLDSSSYESRKNTYSLDDITDSDNYFIVKIEDKFFINIEGLADFVRDSDLYDTVNIEYGHILIELTRRGVDRIKLHIKKYGCTDAINLLINEYYTLPF